MIAHENNKIAFDSRRMLNICTHCGQMLPAWKRHGLPHVWVPGDYEEPDRTPNMGELLFGTVTFGHMPLRPTNEIFPDDEE